VRPLFGAGIYFVHVYCSVIPLAVKDHRLNPALFLIVGSGSAKAVPSRHPCVLTFTLVTVSRFRVEEFTLNWRKSGLGVGGG